MGGDSAHRGHRRRPRRALLRRPRQAARPGPRDHRLGAQRRRTTRSASAWSSPTRRSAASSTPTRRSTGDGARVRPLGRHRRPLPRPGAHLRRARLRRDEPASGCSRSCRQRCRDLGVDAALPHRGPGRRRARARRTTWSSPATARNSAVRAEYADTFGPDLDVRACRYMWLGTDLVFDAFTFIVARDAVRRHAGARLPVRRDRQHLHRRDARRRLAARPASTSSRAAASRPARATRRSIAQVRGAVRRAARRPRRDGQQLALGQLHAPSATRTWRHGNVVLLGDAAHTAHFSIGSGTKLAMEDALALAACLHEQPDVDSALAAYEAERRPVVVSTQRAAQASLEWFENLGQYVAPGPGAVRVQHPDPQPAGHLRQPAAARPRVRRPRRRMVRRPRASAAWPPTPPTSGHRCSSRSGCAASSWTTGSWCRRWTCTSPSTAAERLPPHPPGRQGARRRRAGDDRDGLRLSAGGPDHARLHGPLRATSSTRRVPADRRLRARLQRREDRAAAGSLRPQGLDQADVGGHRRAAGRGQLAGRRRRRRCRTARASTRCRASSRVAELDEIREQFVASAARAAGPGSTCSSCTARTATCCPASSRR